MKIEYMSEADLRDAMIRGIDGAEEAFKWGVDHPRRNPIEAAIAAINAGIWEKNLVAGVEKWAKKLGAVTLEMWKEAAKAAAAMYADRARTIGAKNWEEYYTKAISVIDAASKKLIESAHTEADYIEFFKTMHTLHEL